MVARLDALGGLASSDVWSLSTKLGWSQQAGLNFILIYFPPLSTYIKQQEHNISYRLLSSFIAVPLTV